MCQLIALKAGATLTLEELRNATLRNKDALGVGWFEGTTPKMMKWLNPTQEDLGNALKLINGHKKYARVVHARYATNGANVTANCHPFLIDGRLYAHNGVLKTASALDVSDSRLWLEAMAPIYTDNLTSVQLLLLETLAGTSKLAMLSPTGGFSIINESLGEWRNNAWWSAGYNSCSVGHGVKHPTNVSSTDFFTRGGKTTTPPAEALVGGIIASVTPSLKNYYGEQDEEDDWVDYKPLSGGEAINWYRLPPTTYDAKMSALEHCHHALKSVSYNEGYREAVEFSRLVQAYGTSPINFAPLYKLVDVITKIKEVYKYYLRIGAFSEVVDVEVELSDDLEALMEVSPFDLQTT
jgi:hypothetical protein